MIHFKSVLNSLHYISTGINWNTVITLDLKTMLPLYLVGWWWWDPGKGSPVAQTDLTLFCKVKADLEFLKVRFPGDRIFF